MRNPLWLAAVCLGCLSDPTPARDTGDAIVSPGPDMDAAVDAPALDAAVDAAALDDAGKSATGGPCRMNGDCRSPTDVCHEPYTGYPGGPYGGGDPPSACRRQCESDQQCDRSIPGHICASGRGGCVPAWDAATNTVCAPNCRQVACLVGESCQPDGHCLPTECRQEADCPPNFACGPQGTCERRRCTREGDCQGACVRALCYPTPGACGPPGV
jgi:hypothetical protein